MRALLLVFTLGLAGCHWYEVQDPRSGEIYYTDRWVAADGYTGPLTFRDHTGKDVSLRTSRVTRISRDEYVELTASPDSQAPGQP